MLTSGKELPSGMPSFLTDLLNNQIFVVSALSWFVAQVLKTLIHFYFSKQLVAERMIGSGGMPSSHSATVCALATSTGILYGAGSFEFAMTALFAIVVMHDAMGVRRETGKQALVLNEMIDMFSRMGKDVDIEHTLKEFVGHTPLQVLAGAVLGIVISLLMVL